MIDADIPPGTDDITPEVMLHGSSEREGYRQAVLEIGDEA
jgi:hypothetical protein